MNFNAYLKETINKNQSILCAGFDLDFNRIPRCFYEEKGKIEKRVTGTIVNFYEAALSALTMQIACIKPNSAFFERYGIAGLKALNKITKLAKELKIPVILDAKRGDIGSTNLAYAEGYFKKHKIFGEEISGIYADALTVNPSLGLEASLPFVDVATENKKGLFFLVRTSNPDSGLFQTSKDAAGNTVSDNTARWLTAQNNPLLCAVIGATRADEAAHFRQLMPDTIFLVPGYGAQGGSAKDAVASARPAITQLSEAGIIVNSSRGLFSIATEDSGVSAKEFAKLIEKNSMQNKTQLFNVLDIVK
jgi:orotidine-5'-phosphate decarboxylase